MKLRPYPEYKDSGVPWLGEIPRHWEIISARQIGHLFKGSGGNKNDEVEEGVPCVRYGDLYTIHEFFILNSRACVSPDRLKSYMRIRFGDVLFAASGETIEDIGRSAVNLIRGEACCGGDIIILRPTVEIDPRFLGYALESPAARYQKSSMGRGFTVVHIYGAELKSLVTTFPPLEEQTQIAHFLDWKTAQIDRFIRNKRRLIELLKEQKQALINQAVTGAIDVRTGKPYPEYKDSGVPWLGKVPAGWEVRKLKYIAEMQSGDSLTSEEIQVSGRYPVYGGNGRRGFYENYNREGSLLLIGRQGALCGNVHRADGRFWATEHAVVVAPRSKIHRDWYYYMLIVMDLNQYSESAAQPGISVERVQNLLTTVPDLDEQVEIARHLNSLATAIENAITRTQHQIDLIQEYRTRLIADVVTGKLDVRGVAVPEPEIQEEDGISAAADDRPSAGEALAEPAA